jgi:hypothetical protein
MPIEGGHDGTTTFARQRQALRIEQDFDRTNMGGRGRKRRRFLAQRRGRQEHRHNIYGSMKGLHESGRTGDFDPLRCGGNHCVTRVRELAFVLENGIYDVTLASFGVWFGNDMHVGNLSLLVFDFGNEWEEACTVLLIQRLSGLEELFWSWFLGLLGSG